MISLLIRLCNLRSKNISEDDQTNLDGSYLKELVCGSGVCSKYGVKEAEAILLDSMKLLCNTNEPKRDRPCLSGTQTTIDMR
ncbi:hypothetical protein O9992_01505 [Vibrio lentus]|nr:hypothetical protein [Vibrio lentus]